MMRPNPTETPVRIHVHHQTGFAFGRSIGIQASVVRKATHDIPQGNVSDLEERVVLFTVELEELVIGPPCHGDMAFGPNLTDLLIDAGPRGTGHDGSEESNHHTLRM